MNERVSVVHNGIIENFGELKKGLIAKGHRFETDTDTEVVVHLISDEMAAGSDAVEATRKHWRSCRAPSRWPLFSPARTT